MQDLAAFYDEMGFSKVKKELLESAGAATGAPRRRPPSPARRPRRPSRRPSPYSKNLSSSNRLSRGRALDRGRRPDLDALVAAAVKAGRASVHVECGPGLPVARAAARGRRRGSGRRDRGLRARRGRDAGPRGALREGDRRRPRRQAPLPRGRRARDRAPGAVPRLDARELRRRAGDPRARPRGRRARRPGPPAGGRSVREGPERRGGARRPRRSRPRRAGGTSRRASASRSRSWTRSLRASPKARRSLRVLEEIELPLVPVLARMEKAGVAVDRGVLAGLSKEFDARLAALEAKIHEAAGEPFNIGSPLQLGRILFEKLAYPATKKTAKTKSLRDGLRRPRGARGALDGPGAVASSSSGARSRSSRARTSTRSPRASRRTGASTRATTRRSRRRGGSPRTRRTSRTSRSARRRAARSAARSSRREGATLVAADYSQIELRILAHLSGDEALHRGRSGAARTSTARRPRRSSASRPRP